MSARDCNRYQQSSSTALHQLLRVQFIDVFEASLDDQQNVFAGSSRRQEVFYDLIGETHNLVQRFPLSAIAPAPWPITHATHLPAHNLRVHTTCTHPLLPLLQLLRLLDDSIRSGLNTLLFFTVTARTD